MKFRNLIASDKELFSTEYLSILETEDGYTYVHENLASGGNKVAVLPYAILDGSLWVMGVVERCRPESETPQLCAITGKCDDADLDNMYAAAIRELEEEAGLQAVYTDLIEIGSMYPSKSMDTQVFCYAVNFQDTDITVALGDGSESEANAFPKWLRAVDAQHCTDPILPAMILRLAFYVGLSTGLI